ncbi:MAG: alkaline phosphatase family protein [Bdellovibrionaceae bacterium]|nr:alkaline phosphatase family protein [Bdellovibrio sp.]
MRIMIYLSLLILGLILSSCASREHVSAEYIDQIDNNVIRKQSKQTVVLFLVDGLSYATLETQLKMKNLPHIKEFFMISEPILKAHSVFPSVTYSNISSLLKEQPVHLTGAVGNKFFIKNKLKSFETLSDRLEFTNHMHGHNIFTRLAAREGRTASLDYGLGADATVSTPFDFNSGYAASQTDYRYVDRKKIDSLENLLLSTKPDYWPDFIFIHLVGIDFLSHAQGPRAADTIRQLKTIDEDLQRVFALLKRGEKNHQVISILTADHGFIQKPIKKISFERLVEQVDQKVLALNEGRFAAFYFQKTLTENELVKNAVKVLADRHIELVSFKFGSRIRIISRQNEIYFDYISPMNCSAEGLALSINGQSGVCSDQLQNEIKNEPYPFLIENLASYFKAERPPEMIVIPRRDVSFDYLGVGFHGGPTEEETIVPLLLRNATTKYSEKIPPLWEILRFIQ